MQTCFNSLKVYGFPYCKLSITKVNAEAFLDVIKCFIHVFKLMNY